MRLALSPQVRETLRRSSIDGQVLRLPAGRLDRPTYIGIDKVLAALGAKWDRRAGGHVFPTDPAPKIAEALRAGGVFDEARARIKSLQLFETPSVLADRMVDLLEIGPADRCLEPSAGRGRIVAALAGRLPAEIVAVEIDPDNGGHLELQGLATHCLIANFFDYLPCDGPFTVVAMNPPFRGNQDIRHIRHAWSMLAPGGRMVAIASEHGFIGQENEAAQWRRWLAEIGAETEPLPRATFKESGAKASARLIVARRSNG